MQYALCDTEVWGQREAEYMEQEMIGSDCSTNLNTTG